MPDQIDRLRWVSADWVEKQQNYFKDKRHEDHRKALLLGQSGFIAAVLGWTVAVVLLLGGMLMPMSTSWWLIASGACVLLGGLLVAYCERCAFEETGKQYERMHAVFRQGFKEIEHNLAAHDPGAVQRIMEVLGREAVTENVQWLILRRSRPFELLIH